MIENKLKFQLNENSTEDEETLMEESANAEKEILEKEEIELQKVKRFYKTAEKNIVRDFRYSSKINLGRIRDVETEVENNFFIDQDREETLRNIKQKLFYKDKDLKGTIPCPFNILKGDVPICWSVHPLFCWLILSK